MWKVTNGNQNVGITIRKKKSKKESEDEEEESKDEFAMNVSSASIDRILAEQNEKEEKVELITAFGGNLSSDQPLIKQDLSALEFRSEIALEPYSRSCSVPPNKLS